MMIARLRRKISQVTTLPITIAVCSLGIGLTAWTRLAAQPGAPAKTAEQTYKNIKVLKDVPADQLIPSMQFISASLGVECEFCHVAGAFEKDDKKPKQTARKMMEMMFAINKTNFEDHREVTCYTCHAGSAHPHAIPAIPEGPQPEPVKTPNAKEPEDAAKSKADALTLVDKYVAVIGGADAVRKITSRVEKGTADLAGKQMAIDIYAQAPEKRLSIMHLPNGDSTTAYNGSVGWLSVPGRPTHWMSQGEAEAARLDADLYFPVRLREIFSDFRLALPEKIEGHDTTVVLAMREGKPPVKLYFDQQSGLLVRMLRYADTPLGLNPSQVDYADYKESAGVRIPYRWTLARPSGRFTIQVQDVQVNVPIDAARFAAPAESQAPDHK
jgi:hypothetical protein